MVESKFLKQVYGLIKKTIAIKRKKRIETTIEFMYGIQYIIILVVIHISTRNIQATTEYPSAISQSFQRIPAGYPFPYVNDPSNQSEKIIQTILGQYEGLVFKEFDSQDSLVQMYSNVTTNSQDSSDSGGSSQGILLQGIVFNQVDFQNDIFNYTLLSTDVVSAADSGLFSKFEIELLTIFTSLKTNSNLMSNFTTLQFPYITQLFNINEILYIIYFPLFFMYSLQQLIILIVTEKKDRIKEAMKVMGLRESAYWLSNIIVQTGMNLIMIILMLVISYSSGVFQYISPLMIALMFLIFSLTLISIAFLLSTFFDNPKTAGAISSVFLILGVSISALYQFYLKSHIPALKYFVFFLSPCAFGEFLSGISVAQLAKHSLPWNSPQFTTPLLYMLGDFILYSIISWYCIEVYQADIGTSKGYLFFLRKDYWIQPEGRSIGEFDEKYPINNASLNFGILIQNLTKEFKKSKEEEENSSKSNNEKIIKAVDNLSLNIPRDSILALLGKNGAGKSTTISMLTGLLPPTSGDAIIGGFSMKNQMDHIRKSIGLCPQYNNLYDQLTCSEHIQLVARIRGIEENEIEEIVNRSLAEVNLTDKKDICSSLLSGGQKRRLCFAMAFVSEPNFVLLDECSSGLDPYSRHQIWKVLQQKKIGKTIILTTHFMEEAEVLGETIAIMSKGKLRCLGSSLELKNKFGLGYTLSISFDKNLNPKAAESKTLHIDFENYLYSVFPDAIPLSLNHENLQSNKEVLELSYSLPQINNTILSKFFFEVETNENLNIKNISLNMKTLEEIFLKVSEEDDDENDD